MKKLVFLICLALAVNAFARYDGMHLVRTFNTVDLRNTKAWQIDTHPTGHAFFASQQGLWHFDGRLWRSYKLPNAFDVRSVFIDGENGDVYVGGINEFGRFSLNASGSMQYHSLSDDFPVKSGNVWAIARNNGNVYAQADDHVFVITADNKRHTIDSKTRLLDGAMHGGMFFLATADGLKMLMGEELADAPGADALKGKQLRSLLCAPDGSLVIITARDGAYSYRSGKLSRIVAADKAYDLMEDVFCGAVTDGYLALGSIDDGLAVVNLRDGGSVEVHNHANGLPDNTVLSMSFDTSGDLWVGMDRGLAKVLLSAPVTASETTAYNIGAGYVSAPIPDQDGVYLGTNRGLFRALRNLSGPQISRVSGVGGQIWALDRIGETLFCGADRGLFTVSGDNAKPVGDFVGVWNVQLRVGDIHRAIVGTYDALRIIRYTSDGWVADGTIEGAGGSFFNFIQLDDHRLIVSESPEGVSLLSYNPQTFTQTSRSYIHESADGTPIIGALNVSEVGKEVYVVTATTILHCDRRTGELRVDSMLLPALKPIGRLLRFERHCNFDWLLTDKELLRWTPGNMSDVMRVPVLPQPYRQIFTGKLFTVLNDSTVLLDGEDGFSYLHFGSRRAAVPDSRLNSLISEVRLSDGSDSLLFAANILGAKPDIRLDFNHNALRIVYGDDAEGDAGVLYQWRMNDNQWSVPSPDDAKEFTNLDNGSYLFEVRAIFADGSVRTDSIAFAIDPPWWRSLWAKIIYGLIALGLVLLVILFERRRQGGVRQRAMAEHEHELAEQSKEFDRRTAIMDRRIDDLERQRLEDSLRHKAQEMVNLLTNLSTKNQILIDLNNELAEIGARLPNQEDRLAIMALRSKIDAGMRSDKVLKRVEEEFDIVHTGFLKKLRARYPDLTTSEVKMCAYLKMNLPTKEMAPLLNMSPRGVETLRYRIRKKFGLDRYANMTKFLNDLENEMT